MKPVYNAELSPFAKSVISSLVGGTTPDTVKMSPKSPYIGVTYIDPFGATNATPEQIQQEEAVIRKSLESSDEPGAVLAKSVLNLLDAPDSKIQRLGFTSDPGQNNIYQSLYRVKNRGLPDEILKRIAIKDDLVAACGNMRANQVASYGRPQPDRFSTGFKIEPEVGLMEKLTDEQKKDLQEKISEAERRILTCGKTRGYDDQDSLHLSQYLWIQARNAIIFGRFATEVVFSDTYSGKKQFHSFRPLDVSTIYRCAPMREAAKAVRKAAKKLLEQVKNVKLEPERYLDDQYEWAQVIAGQMRQVFTANECLVHNLYPISDYEFEGYPLTPLDTVITAVETHLNIGTHNKLFFQNGRAAKGMIVIQSDAFDDKIAKTIRQHYQASINSVTNSFRTPVFTVGQEDKIVWQPIDSAGRDMEFQYLSDSNARTILSAFQISPDEIPGYTHLSKGTNSQSLAESNNEYKLEAHRDCGIRPLLGQFQNFLNQRILPLIDEELSKVASIKLVGLDAETAEKEIVRIQEELSTHGTMDEALEKAEKKPLGKRWGGQIPLNQTWQGVLDKFLTVGDIREHFFGIEGSSKDPRYDYLNNPLYFQQVDLLMQQQQMAMQQQQMQAQQAQGQPQGAPQEQEQQGPSDPGQQEPTQSNQPGRHEPIPPQSDGEDVEDLTRSIDQLTGILNKSESYLTPGKRKLLYQQKKIVQRAVQVFEDQSKELIREVLDVAERHLPKQ